MDWQQVFAGGLGAWVDSQRAEQGYVNNPVPRTQDGPQGSSQITSFDEVLKSPLVIGGAVLLIVLVGVLVLKS